MTDLSSCENCLERNENIVVFWQMWYNFCWNVFVIDRLDYKETICIHNDYRR